MTGNFECEHGRAGNERCEECEAAEYDANIQSNVEIVAPSLTLEQAIDHRERLLDVAMRAHALLSDPNAEPGDATDAMNDLAEVIAYVSGVQA